MSELTSTCHGENRSGSGRQGREITGGEWGEPTRSATIPNWNLLRSRLALRSHKTLGPRLLPLTSCPIQKNITRNTFAATIKCEGLDRNQNWKHPHLATFPWRTRSPY